MIESALLLDAKRSWLYVRVKKNRNGAGIARDEFLRRFGREPRSIWSFSPINWVAGPVTDEEVEKYETDI